MVILKIPWLLCYEQLLQVMLIIVHNDEQMRQILKIFTSSWRHDDVVHFHGEDVGLHLAQLSKYLDFTYYLPEKVQVSRIAFDALDSIDLLSLSVFRLDHLPIASFAEEVDQLVVFASISPHPI